MECSRCNSRGRWGETSKWQWVNLKLVSFWSGFRIYKLNFEIISKWPFNLVQLSSHGHNFFIPTLICTLFEALDSWLSKLRKKYIVCIKWTPRSVLNLYSKLEYILPSDFWVLNFHAAESCFMPHFPCFLAFFLTPQWSFFIFQTHDILFLPFLMVHESWLTYFLIWPFLDLSKSKVIQLAPFSSLEPAISLQSTN